MATRRAIERLIALFYPHGAASGPEPHEELFRAQVSLYDLVLIRAQDTVKEARNRDPAVQALLDMAERQVDYASASRDAHPTPVSPDRSLASLSKADSLVVPSLTASRKRKKDVGDDAAPSPHSRSKDTRAAQSNKTSRTPRRTKRRAKTTPPRPSTVGPPAFKKQRRDEDLTELPNITYTHHPGSSSSTLDAPTFKALGECRGQRRKALYKDTKNHNAAETYAASTLKVENLPMSSTGWMGTLYDSAAANALRQAHQAGAAIHRYLSGILLVPYNGLATRILDESGRLIIFRTQIGKDMAKLMPEFIKQTQDFVAECTPMPDDAREDNLRGRHWFCVAGVDRNLKETPAYSEWHRIPSNKAALEKAFLPGTPFSNINGQANDVCARVFPGIARRYQTCADNISRKYSLTPMFGLFWNWCLNAIIPSQGIKRVYCDPHVDWKNIALGVCIVFVYGVFNHHEKAWLVIWEANVCMELPPGVFLLYSSSLFFHFNVDVDAVKIVTTENGETPTPTNSKPLDQRRLQRPEDISLEDWEKGNGRGSVVWFNQASMFQTSETGYDTLTLAREAGHTGNCDVEAFLYGEQAVYQQAVYQR